jgi:hypothetical protein
MSEPISVCLAIGGRLPKRLVARLCRAIIADGVALDWGDAPFRPQTAQELLESCREEKGASVFWVCDDQASWGGCRRWKRFSPNGPSCRSTSGPKGRPSSTRMWSPFVPARNPSGLSRRPVVSP